METWKILIITIAGTIVAGVAAGIFIGKFLVKRAKSGRRRLLSTKERIVYSACVLVGAALILFGVFYKFPSPEAAPPDDMMIIDGGMLGDGGAVDGDMAETGETDGDAGDTDGAESDLPDADVAEDGGIAVARMM